MIHPSPKEYKENKMKNPKENLIMKLTITYWILLLTAEGLGIYGIVRNCLHHNTLLIVLSSIMSYLALVGILKAIEAYWL
jgi:hypothetical protein